MECPVCDRTFPLASINTHVNQCLGSTSDQDSLQSQVADDKNTNVSNIGSKRKKASNWGSLQPMRSCHSSDSPSMSPTAAKKPKTSAGTRPASSKAEGASKTIDSNLFSSDDSHGKYQGQL